MLSTVHLELARCPEFPEGSDRHGYSLTLPLTADGRLDTADWHRVAKLCRFRRFWGDLPEEAGDVQRHGHGWTLAFDGEGPLSDEHEPIFRAEAHTFRSGDYVSIRERDGALRTFRVAGANPVT